MKNFHPAFSVRKLLQYAAQKRKVFLLSKSLFSTGCLSKSAWSADIYSNPVKELQSLVQIPIEDIFQHLFKPSNAEIEQAHKMFQPNLKHTVTAHKAEIYADRLPVLDLPEVAMIGRSNVGKSSLIASLFHDNKQISERIGVSSQPGRTRSIKLFERHQLFTLADLPGYGYKMPNHFVQSVEGYLQNRELLTRIFLLIDSNVGFCEADHTAIEMLEEFGRPYIIVGTKIDKGPHHKIFRNAQKITEKMKTLNCCFPQIFLVSSLYGYGLPYLQTFIAYVTGNINIKSLET